MSKDAHDQNVDTTNVDINIDEFLPMPGAEAVVTSEVKPTVLSTEQEPDLGFLDKDDAGSDEGTGDQPIIDADKALDAITADDEGFEEESGKPGRKKIDKSGLVDVFSTLIKEEMIVPFDDDKALEDYTLKDWKELLQANFEEREKALREATPKEFFESLPQELQYAAEYVSKGGSDLKGLFRALAQVEEVRQLSVDNPHDQEEIARQYLLATNMDPELVDESVQEWVDAGTIKDKAATLKPKLDKMHEKQIQTQLEKQEAVRQEQLKKKQAYMDNIYETLKPAELNGLKLNDKRQKMLWEELTTVKYQSMTGRPTNLLGKMLEDYQFGKEPRYDLIAEVTWLLADPEDYKEQIRNQAKNVTTQETVRKLKTEEGRKITSSSAKDEEEDGKQTRKISRQPTNIFKR